MAKPGQTLHAAAVKARKVALGAVWRYSICNFSSILKDILSMGIDASVLQALGLLDKLDQLADPAMMKSVARWPSPAYDLNPTSVDWKVRILTMNIDFDEGACSVELLQETAGVTCTGQAVVADVGAKRAEITRMARALEHEGLQTALKG